jgi:hypothetical protein
MSVAPASSSAFAARADVAARPGGHVRSPVRRDGHGVRIRESIGDVLVRREVRVLHLDVGRVLAEDLDDPIHVDDCADVVDLGFYRERPLATRGYLLAVKERPAGLRAANAPQRHPLGTRGECHPERRRVS